MLTQFYIIELQQYADKSFGHLIHIAYDEDPDTARLKAEAKYHEVLASAAVSDLLTHSATILSSEGFPIMYDCYKHEAKETQTQEVEV